MQRIISVQVLKAFLPVLFLASSIFGLAPMAFAQKEGAESKLKPASREDIYLYRGLGASYFCNARASKIEFTKSIGIAAATYVQVLNGRHDGFVESAGTNKLTNKQLFNGAEFQILSAALEYCPKEVPRKVKKKLEDAIKKGKNKK
tara:strand:+ start:549 stop:986 length:438 start_codon:yes stop_codon:yes gene_type:complete